MNLSGTEMLQELRRRRNNFIAAMDAAYPDWDTALIVDKVNQYYFTGTMQNALLVIKKGGAYAYYVKLSHERALQESPLENIYPMQSYREIAAREGAALGVTFIEKDIVPVAMLERLQKYFQFTATCDLDPVLRTLRAVKSPLELYWIERSGAMHQKLLLEAVPRILREGMSEAEFYGELVLQMMRHEYHGITRFHMFQTEVMGGQFGFGVNSLYPTNFDGPGGARGYSAAAPLAGDPEKRLRRGDLVFVDIGFGVNGYHSDKTQVFSFGAPPPPEAVKAQRDCVRLQQCLAAQLKPGAIPAQIYRDTLNSLTPDVKENLMGFAGRRVKFFGHGVGLHIDELPVIAQGFTEPLRENMVIALEPKKGLAGIGMVGVEDTYVVTPDGGRCVTGGGADIVVVEA